MNSSALDLRNQNSGDSHDSNAWGFGGILSNHLLHLVVLGVDGRVGGNGASGMIRRAREHNALGKRSDVPSAAMPIVQMSSVAENNCSLLRVKRWLSDGAAGKTPL